MDGTAEVPVMFSAGWCGYCTRLAEGLDGAGIAYRKADIDDDPAVLVRLERISGADWVIPTLEFGDGTVMVNPSVASVAEKLGVTG